MSRRLLVTGAAGFIGANFVRYWLAAHPGDLVVALDALTYAGNRESLPPPASNFSFVHADIRDQDKVAALLRDQALDTIVHFAAESHVDRSISAPDAFIDANIVGTHSLLKAAREAWLGPGSPKAQAHRFHQVSTDEVYGSLPPDAPPCDEAQPYAPNSPYAASKAAADHLVRAYHRTYGLQATISACSNNYGPYQFPEKLIPLCLANILRGLPLPIYGDGLNIRDWLFVADHCRGLDLALTKGRAGERYNIGGSNERTNLSLVKALCTQLEQRFAQRPALAKAYPESPANRQGGAHGLIEFVADRPGHDRRYALDASKARRDLGFNPRHTPEAGLAATIDWYLANRPWWQPLLESQ